ncbi:hypothetical protein ONE63_010016 [Megalurothrips usitatus]|uniref:Uncharacterized protein n=1 Tax=Megalurothrips usitatus TaxID=439358 RepID=A0AAV7XK00_9NEOP|nr:hypothetical protein ONE63_010016 [Megalurothrips usitatus]
MAPVLKKGLFCCLSLRTCALILGAVTLVGNLLTLSMFVVSLDMWLSEVDHHHWNRTAYPEHLQQADADVPLHPDLVANITAALRDHAVADLGGDPAGGHGSHGAGAPGHAEDADGHALAEQYEDDYDGFENSEAMEEWLDHSPYVALALVWFDFVLVLLETLAVVLLIWGAAKRRAEFLLPWLGVEVFTTLYDLGFFAYLVLSPGVVIAIDLMPIILLPITVYCWLVVYSLYEECRETASRNAAMPLSMSALEAGAGAGAGAAPCTVPYGRMAA